MQGRQAKGKKAATPPASIEECEDEAAATAADFANAESDPEVLRAIADLTNVCANKGRKIVFTMSNNGMVLEIFDVGK